MEETTTLIPGLRYLPEYLSAEEHDRFLATVDQQPWITDLRRRVSLTFRTVIVGRGPAPDAR